MNDILLKFRFIDRAGRSVFDVFIVQDDGCADKDTGQQIRFDLDGEHRIKIDSLLATFHGGDDLDG